jgi:hypothetical protein
MSRGLSSLGGTNGRAAAAAAAPDADADADAGPLVCEPGEPAGDRGDAAFSHPPAAPSRAWASAGVNGGGARMVKNLPRPPVGARPARDVVVAAPPDEASAC